MCGDAFCRTTYLNKPVRLKPGHLNTQPLGEKSSKHSLSLQVYSHRGTFQKPNWQSEKTALCCTLYFLQFKQDWRQ